MKRPIYLVISILSLILFSIELKGNFIIGLIINSFFPCQQNPANSFPCFGMYDIYFMFALLIIFLLSLVLFFVHRKRIRG